MSVAKKGDRVKVHYVGTLTTGEKFDSSIDRQEPIEFEVGAGQMIKGFDQAVEGMTVNDQKKVTIPSEDAYGAVREDHFIKVDKKEVPENIEVKVGNQLAVQTGEGQQVPVTITQVEDDHIVLDANHPMAGKDLVFDIQLLEIG